MADQAASQTGDGTGQAASGQQGSQTAAGQQPAQGGQGQPANGQQGGAPSPSQQAGPTGPTPAQPAAPAAASPVVPARYELTLPERSVLDQADVDRVTALAKEKQWSNEQAQAALDEMAEGLSTQHTTLRRELEADGEVGGAHLERAQLLATRVLDRFLPASHPLGQRFRLDLNKSGHGNYLPLVTLLARIGKAMSEDQPGAGAQGRVFTQTVRSQAERLFGDAAGVQK